MTAQVTVKESAIVREWTSARDDSLFLLISSPTMDRALLLDRVNSISENVRESVGFAIGLATGSPVPRGIALYVDFCDERSHLTQSLALLAEGLEREGISATIGPFRIQYSPLDDPMYMIPATIAAVSVRGHVERGATSGKDSWRASETDLGAVVDFAMDWCAVPGGKNFVRVGMSQSRVDLDQRRQLTWQPECASLNMPTQARSIPARCRTWIPSRGPAPISRISSPAMTYGDEPAAVGQWWWMACMLVRRRTRHVCSALARSSRPWPAMSTVVPVASRMPHSSA